MDVTAFQSFLPAGIAQPVLILQSSGRMETATLPLTLSRKSKSRIPRSIPSRHPKEKVGRRGRQLFVNGHWS